MGIRDYLGSFLGLEPAAASDPLAQAYGHTPPLPDVQDTPKPSIGVPYGASGRANFYGLPESDELNRKLIGLEGLRQYDTMYWSDPHVRRLILMAWAPIQAGDWTLDPYGGDQAEDIDRQVAEAVWWALTDFMRPNLFGHLATVGPVLLRAGFCPFEQLWATTEYQGKPTKNSASGEKGSSPAKQQLTLPRKLCLRLPRSVWKWFQDDYEELTAIAQILPNRSDAVIPATELVYYRLAVEGDNWVGQSLLRHAYKPWFYKDRLERIDAVGQERKAVGVPIIYPPKGADAKTKAEVEQIMALMHTSEVAYAMMPGPKAGSQSGSQGVPQDEWLVDVIQFDSSSGESIQASLTYHQNAIASSFAQDFMALGQHEVGARATAEVQDDPYLDAVDSLLSAFILPPIQRLIDRICYVNWGDKLDGTPTLRATLHDQASLTEISAYVQQLALAEAITPDDELEDWLREQGDMPPANPDMRKAKNAARMAGLQQAANPPDPLEMAKAKAAGASAKPGASPSEDDEPNPKKPPAGGAAKTLDTTPTAKWFEQLLSQNRLREAFDGARDNLQAAVERPVRTLAADAAHQAANGADVKTIQPPQDLVDALTSHYQSLYSLGRQTVADELGRQRRKLGTRLDDPTDAGSAAGASRLGRARERGEHSARSILGKIQERLGRDTITGLKDPQTLQTGAEQAAIGQLRMEALSNVAASVNDGRNDEATSTAGVVGAYYTSVMDERSCDPCVAADDGNLLSPGDALAMGPPNPSCQGGDFCRCALVWVLSDDPAALG